MSIFGTIIIIIIIIIIVIIINFNDNWGQKVNITGNMSIIVQFLLSLKAIETNLLCKQTSLFSLHEEVNFVQVNQMHKGWIQ